MSDSNMNIALSKSALSPINLEIANSQKQHNAYTNMPSSLGVNTALGMQQVDTENARVSKLETEL